YFYRRHRSFCFRFSSLLLRLPPGSSLFPYTPLFRSLPGRGHLPAEERQDAHGEGDVGGHRDPPAGLGPGRAAGEREVDRRRHDQDRKSTRLNSSHVKISYAAFCLKKKTILLHVNLRL